jgi:hypothetical protein
MTWRSWMLVLDTCSPRTAVALAIKDEVTLRQAKPAIMPVLDLFELQPGLV